MVTNAAGHPFYEATWLAVLVILLFALMIGTACVFLVTRLPKIARWLRRLPTAARYTIPLAAVIVAVLIGVIALGLVVSNAEHVENSATPVQQDLLQQNLSADEAALDQGVLTYPMPPMLAMNEPFDLTVTVTDLGKDPHGRMSAREYSAKTGMVVYGDDVPTGGILGLTLTCPDDLYCQAIGSARQTVVGTGASRSWSWNITPLHSGAASAVVAATTYDGMSSTVLDEENVPVALSVQAGPWWNVVSTGWDTVTAFTTTTAGQITALGGAVTVIAAGVAWARRKRVKNADTQPAHDAPEQAGTDADQRGYL